MYCYEYKCLFEGKNVKGWTQGNNLGEALDEVLKTFPDCQVKNIQKQGTWEQFMDISELAELD